MKIMSIEEAVEYSRDKKITIHTPTQEAYDRLEKYAREHGLTWLTCNRFPECGSDICVNLSTTHTQCSDIDWYREQGYEIIELNPDRDDARLYFRNNGFNYNLLTEENIDILINMINRTCREFKETLALDILPTARLKKINKREKQKIFKDNHYSICFIVIDGDYFENRECISFNHDGFIGFAGWASDTNVFPIIRAFVRWCDFLNL